jgi:hypothetical protein
MAAMACIEALPVPAGGQQAREGGRFRPGVSGNPRGRPTGSRNQATLAAAALLDGEAEAITRKAIELTLAGDPVARTDGETPDGEMLSRLDEALAHSERTGERWLEAELHRRKGEALRILAPGRPAEAEACFAHALALARRREARFWELRAATSLARFHRDRGRSGDARDLLAPVYDWFTEGFDTPDLIETKALLDTLT